MPSDIDAHTWDLPSPYTMVISVQAQHIDLMQHTNNVNYLQWQEDVAWAHSRALGLGPDEYQALGHGMVVRQHELTYLQATRLGDELILATWLTGIDRMNMYRQHQFVRRADGQTVFRGRTHFVCVDIAAGRPRRMPTLFLETYSKAVVASDPGLPVSQPSS